MYLNIAILANTESTVGGLIFHGWIPPAVKMDNMVGAREVKSDTTRFQGENEDLRSIFIIHEALDHLVTHFHRCIAIQEYGGGVQCGG